MTKFSANLGFLFTELSLTEGIVASAKHGFDAVECHFPYATPATDTKAALDKAGLKMLGLNTIKGNEANGDNGLCAIPERKTEAIAAIDQAVEYCPDRHTQRACDVRHSIRCRRRKLLP